jgi:hypothetical protein
MTKSPIEEARAVLANRDTLYDGPTLKRIIEGLLPDAERYQWLRGNYSGSLELAQAIQLFTPEGLDSAIDAAMKGEK